MTHRIEVGFKEGITDSLGKKILNKFNAEAGIKIKNVKTVEVYIFDMQLSQDEREKLADGPFSDPVIQDYSIDKPLYSDFDSDFACRFPWNKNDWRLWLQR